MENFYDIIIVGCGPSGMTAAIYALRAGASVLIIEKKAVGGQASLTPKIENYPGFNDVDGFVLTQSMLNQVKVLGGKICYASVEKIISEEKIKKVCTKDVTFKAYSVILSMGASSRELDGGIDKKYIGKGVSYCAVCDGAFFKDKTVAVVGGGNTALQDISYLHNLAKEIIHINRRSQFRADDFNTKNYLKLLNEKNGKIKQEFGYVINKLAGESKLENITIKNVDSGKEKTINVDGLFVAIGRVPCANIIDGIKLDEYGYVEVNKEMETNIDGVFACGDVTSKSLRQISTAVGDGAVAGTNASVYVKNLKLKE